MPRKKKRADWGSLKTISKNKHVLRYMANTPEGRKRKSKTFNCSYMEATLERDRLRVLHADKGDKPVPTVGKAYRMWYLPWLERRVADGKAKSGTAKLYAECWDRVIEPRWGSVPIDSTPPMDIQQWLLTLNVGNAKIAMVMLRKIADFALQYETIDANKFRLPYEMPIARARTKRTGTFTLSEAEAMLASLKGLITENSFILACFGSARTGESLGVRSEEVTLATSHGLKLAIVPIVRRMGESGDAPLPDGDLKNPQSVRTLVIPEPYGITLYENAQEKLAAGIEWLADRGDGLPLNRTALHYAWEKDAGENAVPFANLRSAWRTFAQYEWGIDPDTLETLMGHVIPGITGKHYLKPTVENLVAAVAQAVARSRAA